MGVIEDNARLRASEQLRELVTDAEWVLKAERERVQALEKRRLENEASDNWYGFSLVELQGTNSLSLALAQLVNVVASQQEQIAELREQLRRLR